MASEKALLGGDTSSIYNDRTSRNARSKKSWIVIMLEVVNLLFVGSILYQTFTVQSIPKNKVASKKNIIFMVTDGMGPASLSLARSFKQFRDELDIDDILELDRHLIGSSRTRSSSSLITDSAAGATAFSCGLKSYNGAIGVSPDQEPCGTILEALKLQGYYTGLVVTTRITDATPAAFSAHVNYRFQEDLIAEQQLGDSPLGRVVDLIIGGGRCHFVPQGQPGSCRADGRDLLEEAQASGWNYAGSKQEFDWLDNGKNVTFPLLGLLADEDIPYDIDRDEKVHPSLADQARVALNALSRATEDSKKGFFLLIEGSRIDHAGHHNDPAAQVREVLAFDDAFKEVLKFIDETDTETIVISTSDHETGGLVTAKQVSPLYPDYLWYPEVLLNSTHSGEYLSNKVFNQKLKQSDVELEGFEEFITKTILETDLGIKDYTGEEVELIKNANSKESLMYILNNLVSIRSQTGWTTHGHSAVDVNIYGYTNSEALKIELLNGVPNTGLLGNHENTEIGRFMQRITGADIWKTTRLLKDIHHKPLDLNEVEIEETSREYSHNMIIENLD